MVVAMQNRKIHILFVLLLALPAGCRKVVVPPPWTQQGEFHKAIAEADRIVVRDGGFNGPQPVERQKILFQITAPTEIREVYEKLQFPAQQETRSCACFGYPGIDWYRGKQRLAMASVQHCRAIRWEGFPSDAALMPESAAWLKQWLIGHGVKEDAMK
jgi:hypothetical protein